MSRAPSVSEKASNEGASNQAKTEMSECTNRIGKREYRKRSDGPIRKRGQKKPKRVQPFAIAGVRQHKSTEQIRALIKLFKDLKGPINREVRDRAVEMTGLRWHKIYKWMFDLGGKLKAVAPAIELPPSKTCRTNFNTLSDRAFRGMKIFAVTKALRTKRF
jgi:hypothetical protein